MSLYNKASLIQVPSLYKDGLLVSTVPEDRSGDFTFSRGSNLSATRINEQGYIEKGYENLLLQSNSFSNATWLQTSCSVASGQSGYDGSSDAWLLSKSDANGRVRQYMTSTGVRTASIYAKEGTTSWLRITYGGKTTYFDLGNGVLGSVNAIDSTITSVGNGFYRCTLTANAASADYVNIYPADSDGVTSGTSGSIYIQDAMLNQGLVAYPYIETTTAPVAGGILEDEPRIDFSDGCGHLLLEPSRTNLIIQSESSVGWNYQSPISVTSNSSISLEGVNNATKITKVAGGNMFYRIYTTPVIGCFSVFAKKGNWRYIGLRNNQSAGNDHSVFDFDTQTFVRQAAGQTCTFEDYGNGWYRLNSYQPNNEASGLYGIALTDENGTENSGTSPVPDGSYLYVYGFQVEQDATYPTSYIPTYGVSQTRLRDIQSELTIPNGNVSEGTIFYEFDKAQAPNSFDITPLQIGSVKVLSIQQYNPNMRFDINNNAANYNEPNSYNSHIKVAASYVGSVVKLFINGDLRATDNTYSGSGSVVVPENGLQKTQIGCSIESKQLLYFPTALTDSECIALTTIT